MTDNLFPGIGDLFSEPKEPTAKQERIVLARLRSGPLTPLEAISLGVMRLAAVVFNLRALGHRIESEDFRVTKADGSTTVVARYHLHEAHRVYGDAS